MMQNSLNLNLSASQGVTMKDQVQHIDITIGHFRKQLDGYKKNRLEIQFQLKKFQQLTMLSCDKLQGQINSRVKYLSDVFRNQHANEEKQLDYLQIQNQTLTQQNQRLMQLGSNLQEKVRRAETNVGI